MLYTNMFPLVGEYQKYKNYDSVEATYIAHWARKLALRGLDSSSFTSARSTGYLDITNCSLYNKSGKEDTFSWCQLYEKTNNVTKIYLTPYSVSTFKTTVKNSSSYQRPLKEYVKYMPTYKNNTSKSSYYRVIVEYERHGEYHYGTIEVKK